MSKEISFAILTVPITRGKKRFGPQESNFIKLANMAKKRKVNLYVFSPENVSWTNKKIRAWIYNPAKKVWTQGLQGFPDVIYNRVPTRSKEKKDFVRKTIDRFMMEYDIPIFNPFFLDKIEIHEILAQDREVQEFVPEAIIKPTYQQLIHFINKKGKVYLKPAQSSVGRGILVLEKNSSGGVLIRGIEGPSSSSSKIFDGHKLKQFLAPQITKRRFLAQEAIDLAEYEGRSFDIRTLIQKDGWGTWQLTGMGARVAAVGHHTTHVPNGGQSQSLQQVLKRILPEIPNSPEQIVDKIRTASLVAAKAIEASYGKIFGEFSLDLALDKKGQLQIIEVNSKPFIFDERDVSQLARQRLLDFGAYLGRQ